MSARCSNNVFSTRCAGKQTVSRLNLCNREWLLKNSLLVANSQNSGDRECLADARESFVGHPYAISFLRISAKGVLQQPRDITTAIRPIAVPSCFGTILEMEQNWCCPEFQEHSSNAGGKSGFRAVFVWRGRRPFSCYLSSGCPTRNRWITRKV